MQFVSGGEVDRVMRNPGIYVETMLRLCALEERMLRISSRYYRPKITKLLLEAYLSKDYDQLMKIATDNKNMVYTRVSSLLLAYTIMKQLYPTSNWIMYHYPGREGFWFIYNGDRYLAAGFDIRKIEEFGVELIIERSTQLCTADEIIATIDEGVYLKNPRDRSQGTINIKKIDKYDFARYVSNLYSSYITASELRNIIDTMMGINADFPLIARDIGDPDGNVSNMTMTYVMIQKQRKVYEFVLKGLPLANCIRGASTLDFSQRSSTYRNIDIFA